MNSIPFLTERKKQKAIHALQTYGFTVIIFFYKKELIQQWTHDILQDFRHATQLLQNNHDIDILHPGKTKDALS